MPRRSTPFLALWLAAFAPAAPATCQETGTAAPALPADAVETALRFLLDKQNDDGQLPCHTGFYSVLAENGIAIGYRVGGTAIGALALLRTPGYAESRERQEAVAKAVRYVAGSIEHPMMSHDFATFRDVHGGKGRSGHPAERTFSNGQRGWGYTYGLLLLLELRARELLPADQEAVTDRAIAFFLQGLAETELEAGGWDYLLGKDHRQLATILTAPTLQALFEARRQGLEFDEGMVRRGLLRLENTRSPQGTWPYLGMGGDNLKPESSVGRRLVCECTLFRADRSDAERLAKALEAFFAHWKWLEEQRGSPTPHARPFFISSYYFFYAHYYAAMAIELLPEADRKDYRERLEALIAKVRLDNGAWSERIQEHPQIYGTAMAVLVLTMPQNPPLLTRWKDG